MLSATLLSCGSKFNTHFQEKPVKLLILMSLHYVYYTEHDVIMLAPVCLSVCL